MMAEEHRYSHPTPEMMEEVVHRVASLEDVAADFPTLWAHLQTCNPCLAAFTELLQIAHEEGHREGHMEEARSRRIVLTVAVAGILAVTMVAMLIVWVAPALFPSRSEEARVNRIYTQVSPAVAHIQVRSAGVTGSGVTFDRDGHILTNYHVVKDATNDADIRVLLPGMEGVTATVVGYDQATDLAVLKVEVPPKRLTIARFGDSNEVRVGDLAIAIGNPFGLSQTLTVGHISAIGRRLMTSDPYAPDIDGVLQTDAPINPGNSGGPLLNADGEVIGINTAIKSPSGGSVGIGFAIPSNTVREVVRELIQHGYVRRPFLGVEGRPLDPVTARGLGLPVQQGVLVQRVHPGSPAEQAGLRAGKGPVRTIYGELRGEEGDIILSLDGHPVRNRDELNRLVVQHHIGDRVTLEILRDGQRMTVEVTLGERPHE